MKLLAKPTDFYNIEIDTNRGSATDHPFVEITVSDETDDGIPALVTKVNELIDRGFRFNKFELGGDMIGWKYFTMEMQKK